MAIGIQIYFGGGTPGPTAVEYDNFMLIVDGDESTTISEAKVLEISEAETLTDYGFTTDSRAYKSAALFFSASPTPSTLFIYVYVESTTSYEDYPLEKTTETKWETPLKPATFDPEEEEKVRFYDCDNSTGFAWNYANGSQGLGFTLYNDTQENWTGELRFLSGLSGTDGIVTEDNMTTDCKITADFSVGGAGGLGEAIEQYSINGICMATDPVSGTNYESSDLPMGSDQVDALMKLRNATAGKQCLMFFSLPGEADPDDEITGASEIVKWGELMNKLIGGREDFHAHKMKATEQDDMATGLMGIVAATHPHKTMSFVRPHMGIAQAEPLAKRRKFSDGQIATIMQRPELQGSPYLLTQGFTFGSGDFSRINGTRCKYVVAQNLRNAMWALLAERETYCSVSGCDKIEARIRGVFNYLIAQGIIDGLEDIRIPMRSEFANNTEAARLAAQRNQIPGVEIDYIWYKSVEQISITQVDNIAT